MRSIIFLVTAALAAAGCGGAQKIEAPVEKQTPCMGDIPGCVEKAEAIIKESPFNCDSALPLLEDACGEKNGDACYTLAKVHDIEAITEPSEEKALKFYSEACDLEHEDGCLAAAMLLLAQTEKEEVAKGASMLVSHCEKGSADACASLAGVANAVQTLLDEKLDFKTLAEKAGSLYEAQCEKQDAASCRSIGEMLASGFGLKKDLKKAAEYFERGCELEDGESCALFGIFLEIGKGVQLDIENAEIMYQHSCELNDPKGCVSLGVFLRERGSIEEAIKYYKKSCDLWGGMGCYELAVAHDTGSGVTEDKNKAFEYYKKACNLKYPGGCDNLGRMYQTGDGVEQDYEESLKLYIKVCDGLTWKKDRVTAEIVGDACNNAGAVYSQGLGVVPNIKIAVEYFKKGCILGDPIACKNRAKLDREINAVSRFDAAKQCYAGSAKSCYDLGIMWGNGVDGPKDLKQAKHWVKVACDNGYKDACELLPSMKETE